MMDDFDDLQSCPDDLHCPPLLVLENDRYREVEGRRCACPCHRQEATLADTVVAYLMLLAATGLLVWFFHALACGL